LPTRTGEMSRYMAILAWRKASGLTCRTHQGSWESRPRQAVADVGHKLPAIR
jgi:hypothetical protein